MVGLRPMRYRGLCLITLFALSVSGALPNDNNQLVTQRDVPDWTLALLAGSPALVKDAKCNLASVRKANSEQLNVIFSNLLNTSYFRLFRVNVDGECPLDKQKDTAVEEEELCTGPKVPMGMFGLSDTEEPKSSCSVDTNSIIDHTTTSLEDKFADSQASETDCDDESSPNFWLNMCDKLPTSPSEFVNLQLNQEHYTGYNGSKIWEAIYVENCFKREPPEDMCYEERVMYRLLSGLHASINTHIAMQYHPPKKGVSDVWLPNPKRFMNSVGNHQERINNLHFAFVVLLRALRKATPVLRSYNYDVGDSSEDVRTPELMEHLLDSYVLSSCQNVFEAFDESLLFQEHSFPNTISSMKRDFKDVFHNISDIFNCIKCQRCRLHGKMQLLGVGTALKVLLLPEELISLSRDEVVAFLNTLGKFSEALQAIPGLVEQYYWEGQSETVNQPRSSGGVAPTKEGTLAVVADASRARLISTDLEDILVDAALDGDEDIALLAMHFGWDLEAFARHAQRRLRQSTNPDAVIVGGGLAGVTAALTILDKGGKVALLDKEALLGGNSVRASSGINGIDNDSVKVEDSVDVYTTDVLLGGGYEESASHELVSTLTDGSVDALKWLRDRVGIPLEKVSQLGGHSRPRTHRPAKGLAGSELVAAVKKHLNSYIETGQLKLYTKTKAINLISNEGRVTGVKCLDTSTGNEFELSSSNVVLATGGYAFDTSDTSLVKQYRPDLTVFGTTNGAFATGDGIRMAQQSTGAATIDLDQVQVHPTGFVDLKNKTKSQKMLCAEMLRSVGGILLDLKGNRFANELGTRDYLSSEMLKNQPGVSQPEFTMLLNQQAASKADVHIPMYVKKGLLFEMQSLEDVAEWMKVPVQKLHTTLGDYDNEIDHFGKSLFPSLPFLGNGPYYVAKVTPVLHYSMGGLKVNTNSQVVTADGKVIEGLYAAGEVVGGIHGKNRLGGNALTECVVFGRISGLHIPISKTFTTTSTTSVPAEEELPTVSSATLAQHNAKTDCWVQLYENIFDLTEFAEDHPGGVDSITDLCGLDGTVAFEDIHSREMLHDFKPVALIA